MMPRSTVSSDRGRLTGPRPWAGADGTDRFYKIAAHCVNHEPHNGCEMRGPTCKGSLKMTGSSNRTRTLGVVGYVRGLTLILAAAGVAALTLAAGAPATSVVPGEQAFAAVKRASRPARSTRRQQRLTPSSRSAALSRAAGRVWRDRPQRSAVIVKPGPVPSNVVGYVRGLTLVLAAAAVAALLLAAGAPGDLGRPRAEAGARGGEARRRVRARSTRRLRPRTAPRSAGPRRWYAGCRPTAAGGSSSRSRSSRRSSAS